MDGFFVFILKNVSVLHKKVYICDNKNNQTMIITATQDFKKVVFKWNEELTECSYSAINVDEDVVKEMISNKTHEGNDFNGWNVEL